MRELFDWNMTFMTLHICSVILCSYMHFLVSLIIHSMNNWTIWRHSFQWVLLFQSNLNSFIKNKSYNNYHFGSMLIILMFFKLILFRWIFKSLWVRSDYTITHNQNCQNFSFQPHWYPTSKYLHLDIQAIFLNHCCCWGCKIRYQTIPFLRKYDWLFVGRNLCRN